MRSGWVTITPEPVIPGETLEDIVGPYAIGAAVRVSETARGSHPGRTGKVVGWGRSIGANAHWTEHHSGTDPTKWTCTFGEDCDALADEEGPLVRYNDQDDSDESLDWWPGQSCGALEVVNG